MPTGPSREPGVVDEGARTDGMLPSVPGARAAWRSPEALPTRGAELPETYRYRLKNFLLGPPLVTEQLSSERIGKPTALAILSSDVISSSAYATEQALIPLIQVVGVAAFSLLVPVSIAVIVVLAFVTLSYLEVVKVYTKAGGAYVVSRENFGLTVAQVAAMSLLIDYTLTVAVSVAAGVAALTSVFPVLTPSTTWIAVALVVLLAYGNLRGVREAGRVFAFPTYFFVGNMALLLIVGLAKDLAGELHAHSIHVAGAIPIGHGGSGLLYGASLFILLRSFASGGSALTGTEAISNSVAVFRKPEARNARITMVVMSLILGSLVLGVSALAAAVHPVPHATGTPTVVSQIAKYVYGTGAAGHTLFVLLQASTMMILVLAANTSFTGFPYLASFAAEDSYLPRQLTKRGHRLVFSTGIIVLTVVSIFLLLVTRAKVDNLIPLYAIGVFTGFSMAGAGMFKFHLAHRRPQWRRRAIINGAAGVLSFLVDIIIVVTKFNEGAWAIVIVLPLGVFFLLRLHRQYETEAKQLEVGAAQASVAPILRHHVVVVLVDRLDMAVARAIQYARTLTPDDLRAVHFEIDSEAARRLETEWRRLGLSRMPLDVVECRDRRLVRATLELVAEAVADGDTECTVLLPRRRYGSLWERFLHERSADKIAAVLSEVPHVSATIVPYTLSTRRTERLRRHRRSGPVAGAAPELAGRKVGSGGEPAPAEPGPSESDRRERPREREPALMPADVALADRAGVTTAIADVAFRQRVRLAGRIKSVRVQPRSGASNLECVLSDGSGAVLLVFLGRPRIREIEPGARLVVEGMVGSWGRRFAILNPEYEVVAGPDSDDGGTAT